METLRLALVALVAVSIVALSYVLLSKRLRSALAGSFLLFVVVALLPSATAVSGFAYNMQRSTQVGFCVGCHEMEPYGKSLLVDDSELVPATHFQRHLVSPQTACYDCHKDYAMFGTLRTKLNGLRHVWVHYFGPQPEVIALYRPYANRNCLSCHLGARGFEENKAHRADLERFEAMKASRVSCITSGCHDVAHDVAGLDERPLWHGKDLR
jgi:cytochrome c-type protein NapC